MADEKVPDSGTRAKTDEQKTEEKKVELEFNKLKELERKAGKYADTKKEADELRAELARLRGGAEVLAGTKKQQPSADEEINYLGNWLRTEDALNAPLSEYQSAQVRYLELLAGKGQKAGEDTAKRALESYKAETELSSKYGHVMSSDEKLKAKYESIVSAIPGATYDQKLKIAEAVFGDEAKTRQSEMARMGGYYMGGSGSGANTGKYAHLASNPSIRELAETSVKRGICKSAEEFYDMQDTFDKAHNPLYSKGDK